MALVHSFSGPFIFWFIHFHYIDFHCMNTAHMFSTFFLLKKGLTVSDLSLSETTQKWPFLNMCPFTHIVFSQGINPEVGLLSCRTCTDLQLYWVLPHCSPKELYPKKYSHHQCIRMPITVHRCHQSIVADSFIFAYLMAVKWYLVLICFPDSQGERRTSFHLYCLGIHF